MLPLLPAEEGSRLQLAVLPRATLISSGVPWQLRKTLPRLRCRRETVPKGKQQCTLPPADMSMEGIALLAAITGLHLEPAADSLLRTPAFACSSGGC